MKIYLVWTGYEDVEAAFFKEEDAETFITEYLRNQPTNHPLNRSDISITEMDCK